MNNEIVKQLYKNDKLFKKFTDKINLLGDNFNFRSLANDCDIQNFTECSEQESLHLIDCLIKCDAISLEEEETDECALNGKVVSGKVIN